jgi:hypothetical protein
MKLFKVPAGTTGYYFPPDSIGRDPEWFALAIDEGPNWSTRQELFFEREELEYDPLNPDPDLGAELAALVAAGHYGFVRVGAQTGDPHLIFVHAGHVEVL